MLKLKKFSHGFYNQNLVFSKKNYYYKMKYSTNCSLCGMDCLRQITRKRAPMTKIGFGQVGLIKNQISVNISTIVCSATVCCLCPLISLSLSGASIYYVSAAPFSDIYQLSDSLLDDLVSHHSM